MDSSHGERSGEASRRDFLKSAAAGGSAAALLPPPLARPEQPAAPPAGLPTTTLGKTGQKCSVLGMGTSWDVAPSFVQAALRAGLRYIDTSENYEGGNAERRIGEVLERTGLRKDVYVVTKNSRAKVGGPGAYKRYLARLEPSLERLRTDYVDCYYFHGVTGRELPLFKDPDVKAAFENLKKLGKIRFCGISCHDPQLPEIVTAAAQCGWIDQIMIQYNYRTMNGDNIRRALDLASKANLALVAMKSQAGAGHFPEVDPNVKFNGFVEKGFKKEQAAIKTIFAEGRMQVVVSEMTNRDQLRENIAACHDDTLSLREEKLLEEYRLATAHLYCHGCGQHCEPAAGGSLAIADIMRYLRYHDVYGKRQNARALYQALAPEARNVPAADLAAAAAACPHGLPVVELITRADKLMG
jgi:predicted aldo/keto reductase-like oxidoreductase